MVDCDTIESQTIQLKRLCGRLWHNWVTNHTIETIMWSTVTQLSHKPYNWNDYGVDCDTIESQTIQLKRLWGRLDTIESQPCILNITMGRIQNRVTHITNNRINEIIESMLNYLLKLNNVKLSVSLLSSAVFFSLLIWVSFMGQGTWDWYGVYHSLPGFHCRPFRITEIVL